MRIFLYGTLFDSVGAVLGHGADEEDDDED